MTGKYEIVIQNRRIAYKIKIERNINVIKGDSATGKTMLVEMIETYNNDKLNKSVSSVKIECDKECIAISDPSTWKAKIDQTHDSIIFIDEGMAFISSDEFASTVKNNDNYFVIITRERLCKLPYSIEAVFGIVQQQKIAVQKRVFNESYNIYKARNSSVVIPDVVVTEDSKSGYQFFSRIANNAYKVYSAGSKDKFIKTLREHDYFANNNTVLLIADGAAFGCVIDNVLGIIKKHKNICLFAPESFEYILLNSDIFDELLKNNNTELSDSEINDKKTTLYLNEVLKNNRVSDILENTYAYADSTLFFSWERFYTCLLHVVSMKVTNKLNSKSFLYPEDKHNLPEVYSHPNIVNKILKKITRIKFLGTTENK